MIFYGNRYRCFYHVKNHLRRIIEFIFNVCLYIFSYKCINNEAAQKHGQKKNNGKTDKKFIPDLKRLGQDTQAFEPIVHYSSQPAIQMKYIHNMTPLKFHVLFKLILTDSKGRDQVFHLRAGQGCPARLKNAHMTGYDALSVYLSIHLLRAS